MIIKLNDTLRHKVTVRDRAGHQIGKSQEFAGAVGVNAEFLAGGAAMAYFGKFQTVAEVNISDIQTIWSGSSTVRTECDANVAGQLALMTR